MPSAKSLQPINYGNIYGEVKRVGTAAQSGSIQFNANQTLSLLSTLLLHKKNILFNELGIYAIADRVTGGTAYWASLDNLEWVTKARPSSCSRTAQTDHNVTEASATLCKSHVFMKFCKDSLVAELNAIWSAMWGAGNDLNDILATPEGVQWFDKFVERQVSAIGNDFTNIVEFGGHSIIASAVSANENSYSEAITTTITATFGTCDGRLKRIDALKTGSYPHINNTFVSGTHFTGRTFDGDALGIVNSLRTSAHADFGGAMDALRADYTYPVCEVSGSFYERLIEQITALYPALVSSLQYTMNGTAAAELGVEMKSLITPDAFIWKGMVIVARYDWDNIARKVGFVHHRVLLSVPQNYGVAIDIPNEGMAQYDGMGMIITKSPVPTDGGAYYMETNYQVATALLRNTHIVNWSYTGTL